MLDLDAVLGDERFDVVFTSYGVLWWLQDLARWGRSIAGRLVPGGRFYIVEFHPFVSMLDDNGASVRFDYFPGDEPHVTEECGSYAAPEADVRGRSTAGPTGSARW